MPNSQAIRTVLVTGATGYVGGRLVPLLLDRGYQVRVLARDAVRLAGRSWVDQVEVDEGSVLNPDDLPPILGGIDVAYYLIHNMTEREGYREQEQRAARNFASAACAAGVKRIIYLGALGDPQSDLALHLRSRQKTGQVLAEYGIPVTEFRAAIIVGSGSISFEMIRYLTEKLPVLISPRWVFQQVQPISIEDVLAYLVAALTTPESSGKVIEIGGADQLPYAEMLKGYAEIRGLKRTLIPVPILTPELSSHWVHWITPWPAVRSGKLKPAGATHFTAARET
ncbi:MAG: NAD(P)H-binding protein [Anaerolineales bacterium]